MREEHSFSLMLYTVLIEPNSAEQRILKGKNINKTLLSNCLCGVTPVWTRDWTAFISMVTDAFHVATRDITAHVGLDCQFITFLLAGISARNRTLPETGLNIRFHMWAGALIARDESVKRRRWEDISHTGLITSAPSCPIAQLPRMHFLKHAPSNHPASNDCAPKNRTLPFISSKKPVVWAQEWASSSSTWFQDENRNACSRAASVIIFVRVSSWIALLPGRLSISNFWIASTSQTWQDYMLGTLIVSQKALKRITAKKIIH